MNTKSEEFVALLQRRDELAAKVAKTATAVRMHGMTMELCTDDMSMQELQEARHAYEELKHEC